MPQPTGACLGGAVRYTTMAVPVVLTVCHRRDCQRFTGSAFSTLVGVPKEALTIDGAIKPFTSLGGSGMPILRHFCSVCGSSIAEKAGTAPSRAILKAGTLDDPKSLIPAREIFCDDALPWARVIGDVPRFAKCRSEKTIRLKRLQRRVPEAVRYWHDKGVGDSKFSRSER